MSKKLIKYGSPLPLILLVASLVLIVSTALTNSEDAALAIAIPMIICTFAAVVLCWFYIIYLMIHAYKNLNSTDRMLWMILIYMLNVFVFPVYCFKFLKD